MKTCDLHSEGKLPERAGDARLTFEKIGYPLSTYQLMCTKWRPWRNGDLITIPFNEKSQFYALAGGEKFITVTCADSNNAPVHFGGTDEKPFLTELDASPLSILQGEGEEGFFEWLKPDLVKEWEKKYGTTAKRQGDIYAVAIPFDMATLGSMAPIFKTDVKEVVDASLFGSGHLLTGMFIGDPYGSHYEPIPRIFQGTLEAKDHQPLVLDTPHAMARVAHLRTRNGSD